jgi:hypothetical protein
MLVPILLFKLWSVLPKLFEWPPLRSPAHMLERVSLFLLVGGAGFEFVTGILNIQTWYKFPGSFYPLHFYGAWVFTAGFVVHVGLKLPSMIRALRSRSLIGELRTSVARTRPEPADAGYLVSPEPAAPTISRRGVLAFAAAGSVLIGLLTVGQSIGGPLRRTALLAPHGQDVSGGPGDFQVNKTAAEVGITESETGASWRLTVGTAGQAPVVLSRADLRRLLRWYGANPLHLLTMLGSFALAGYAAAQLLPLDIFGIALWFAGAVIGHDLLLMPLYTLADRSASAVFRHIPPKLPAVQWINYLRVPVVLSGLLLLIWFPLIFRLPTGFQAATTLSLDPYLWHWLAVTGALFLLSAIALAVRLRRSPSRLQALPLLREPVADRPAGNGEEQRDQHDALENLLHAHPDRVLSAHEQVEDAQQADRADPDQPQVRTALAGPQRERSPDIEHRDDDYPGQPSPQRRLQRITESSRVGAGWQRRMRELVVDDAGVERQHQDGQHHRQPEVDEHQRDDQSQRAIHRLPGWPGRHRDWRRGRKMRLVRVHGLIKAWVPADGKSFTRN